MKQWNLIKRSNQAWRNVTESVGGYWSEKQFEVAAKIFIKLGRVLLEKQDEGVNENGSALKAQHVTSQGVEWHEMEFFKKTHTF